MTRIAMNINSFGPQRMTLAQAAAAPPLTDDPILLIDRNLLFLPHVTAMRKQRQPGSKPTVIARVLVDGYPPQRSGTYRRPMLALPAFAAPQGGRVRTAALSLFGTGRRR